MNDTLEADTPQTRLVTAEGLRKIVVIAICGSIIAFLMNYFSPASRQERNLQAAQRHADLINPTIHADPRFRDVNIARYTGDEGCLWVLGSVSSDAAREALRSAVDASVPPVKVRFDVYVFPDPPNQKH